MSLLVAPFDPGMDVRFNGDESRTDNGEHYNVDINSAWGWEDQPPSNSKRQPPPPPTSIRNSFSATHLADRSRENVSKVDRCSILIFSRPEYRIYLMKNAIGISLHHFHGSTLIKLHPYDAKEKSGCYMLSSGGVCFPVGSTSQFKDYVADNRSNTSGKCLR